MLDLFIQRESMKSLIHSWMNSLTLFLPTNLLQLLKAVVGALWDVFLVLMRNFWWAGLLALLLFYMHAHWTVLIILLLAWFLILLLAARPSLMRKDLSYFGHKMLYAWPLVLFFVVSCSLHPLIGMWIIPYLVLAQFFICDAPLRFIPQLKSFKHAAVMVFKKAPIYLLLVGVWYGMSSAPLALWLLLLIPLYIIFISRLYIVWLHKEYQDYHEVCR